MDKKHYTAIRKLLLKKSSKVKRSAVWQEIVSETGLGIRQGANYAFTDDDKEGLRKHSRRKLGLDPLFDELETDRLTQSEKAANEKLARGTVFGQSLILAATGQAPIPLITGELRLPSFAFLGVPVGTIDIPRLSERHLVIIENGSLMTEPHRLDLPPPWNNAVLIYRGHGDDAKALKRIMATHPQDRLALFYDFDPAGMDMALTVGGGALIVPQMWIELTERCEPNKRDSFYEQAKQLVRAQNLTKTPELNNILAHMEKEKLAVTQEALVSNGIKLMAILPRDQQRFKYSGSSLIHCL